MPTRLADGLGPGSDLGHCDPNVSVRGLAPRPRIPSRNLVPPRWPPGREVNLGYYRKYRQKPQIVKSAQGKRPTIRLLDKMEELRNRGNAGFHHNEFSSAPFFDELFDHQFLF